MQVKKQAFRLKKPIENLISVCSENNYFLSDHKRDKYHKVGFILQFNVTRQP